MKRAVWLDDRYVSTNHTAKLIGSRIDYRAIAGSIPTMHPCNVAARKKPVSALPLPVKLIFDRRTDRRAPSIKGFAVLAVLANLRRSAGCGCLCLLAEQHGLAVLDQAMPIFRARPGR